MLIYQPENIAIPGQAQLERQVRGASARDALSHGIILSGQGDLRPAARFIAAAMECVGEEKPCGACGPCRKVLGGIHPDVVSVEDPEHKNISVDVLRGVVSDAYILPNEGRRKLYIFPDCGLLDPKAQNVLLKVLEDGPPKAAFLFCARNSAALLPTIRSRAVEWKLSPEAGGEADGEARRLCGLIAGNRPSDIAAFFAELENRKISREELLSLLSGTRDLLAAGLAASYGAGGDAASLRMAQGMGRRRISAVVEVLEAYIRRCGFNTGVGHLAGALAAELSE